MQNEFEILDQWHDLGFHLGVTGGRLTRSQYRAVADYEDVRWVYELGVKMADFVMRT